MARKIPTAELDDLFDILRTSGQAMALGEIEANLTRKIPSRTLRNRLNSLIKNGTVIREGRFRSARYRLANGESTTEAISLSTSGQAALAYVSQPLAKREPTGYDREFLESYHPGKTSYLPSDLSGELMTLGQRQGADRKAGTFAKRILHRFLVDLAWNSSRLEGNTFSYLDTRRLIAFGEKAEGKNAAEVQMILNHKNAVEFLVDGAETIGLNRYTILNLHGLLADNLLPDPGAPGRLRQIHIGIQGSAYQPPLLPAIIEECFDTILRKASAIVDPLEQAFFVLVHLPRLQPFEDVNKRTSRLAANIPLIKANLAPLSFEGVPRELYTMAILAIYERQEPALLRDVFEFAYRRSAKSYAVVRQSIGDPDLFRLKYRKELAEVIYRIVAGALPRPDTPRTIAEFASANIPEMDCARFRAIAEEEILSLHEGNFSRYRISQTEFLVWRGIWAAT